MRAITTGVGWMVLLLAACGPPPDPVDGGVDASVATDVGPDALDDAGFDAFVPPDVGASLVISPSPFDFGARGLGCGATGAQTFTITSPGVSRLDVVSVALSGLDASAFVMVNDGCTGVVLPPGGSCTVDVDYRPTGAGAHSASLDVTASGGGAASASLSGQGLAPAGLRMTPRTRNFGTVGTGLTSATVDFLVTNECEAAAPTLTATTTGIDADEFHVLSDLCTGAALAGHAACTLSVQFAPTRVGAAVATLSVTSGPSMIDAALTATGVTSEGASFTPASHDFGGESLGCHGTAPWTFTLTNVGGSTLAVDTASIVGVNPADFPIVRDGCSSTMLAPGSSCSVDVAFHPTSAGARVASLSVTSGSFVALAALTGVGQAPAPLALAPRTHDYGTVAVGSSASTDFTVTNTCATAADVGTVTSAITGLAAAAFHVLPSTCDAATLAGGEQCVITVAFEPTATGSATAVLNVSSTTLGASSADLGGSGG